MQYECATQRFDPEGTVSIPDEAVGVTVTESGTGDDAIARYLIPVEVDA